MSAEQKPNSKPSRLPFHLEPQSGSKLAVHALLRAVYMDDQDLAESIMKAEPEQINRPEPFAGLTPIHVAVFRNNNAMVELLALHPRCDVWQKDNFERTAVDMLRYTSNRAIFNLIMRRAYPNQERAWMGHENAVGGVVSFIPKKDS